VSKTVWTNALFLLFLIMGAFGGHAEAQGPGRIVGHIDGLGFDEHGCHIWGWACQQGTPESLTIHIYAGESANGPHRGKFVMQAKADLPDSPSIDQACRCGPQGRHRFDVRIPTSVIAQFHGEKIFVHGIRVQGNVENSAVGGSGSVEFPPIAEVRIEPNSYPRLSGEYISSSLHPHVFFTDEEIRDLAQRINRHGSYSAQRFAHLVAKLKTQLQTNFDWDEAYNGCDMEIYLRGFSYEAKPAYGNDRSDEELCAAMNVKPGMKPLHGGALVASQLALYASLVKAGANVPPGSPGADEATAIAKRILLAWADHGFHDATGNYRVIEAQYCDLDMNGKPKVTQFGTFFGALTLSRGVIFSVHAQDLLEGLHALNAQEVARLNAFHRAMYHAVLNIHNEEFAANMKWKYRDEFYNNQTVGHLGCLLSIARLFDDHANVEAILYGGEGSRAVKVPWVSLFDHVIYGPSDHPLVYITPNHGNDSFTSHPAYSSPIVAAGEINDRYRNANPSQGIGYPMGTLEGLYQAAELLRIAGFDPYGYRGAHGQSIEMATRYYALYGKSAGFRKTITAENSSSIPDYKEYLGRTVNGVDNNALIGALRFPNDTTITDVEYGARESAALEHLTWDSILFGKWRD